VISAKRFIDGGIRANRASRFGYVFATAVALALVALAVLGARGGDSARPAVPSRTYARDGVAVRVPAGWHVITRNETYVTNPALCFELRSRTASVKLVEYLAPNRSADMSFYPPGAARFRLAMLREGDDDWSRGETWEFRDHRRIFYVGALVRAVAGADTRRTVEEVVRSVRARAPGRCHPTA
jgi:hypothetical protein